MNKFLLAEIGKDDEIINEYLDKLPHINLIYNAPPNQKSIRVWQKMAKKSSDYDYQHFFSSLTDIYTRVKPTVLIIEVLENEKMMLNFLTEWNYYTLLLIKPLTYSAPLKAGKSGMSYRRNENKVIIASNIVHNFDFEYTYSHEFLDGFLTKNPQYRTLTAFDPCIGKGLLARYVKDCYGIEFNNERLQETIKTHNSLL